MSGAHINLKNDEEGSVKIKKKDDIEYIISDIGGSYGKFQIFNYILYSIPMCVSGIVAMTYVFTALNLDYRCVVPECDSLSQPNYNADWIANAIPITNSKPAKCHRYEKLSNEPNHGQQFHFDRFVESDNQICPADLFNRSSIVRCDEDGLVYKTNEVTIANEFNITCSENEWKLAMVGSYNNIARFIFLPLTGILSDRFGRKTMLIVGLVVTSVAGLIQSFSINYTMFVILEFLSAITAAGVYPSGFILGMEWAGVEHRVVVSSLIVLPYGMGIMLTGGLAAYARNFRLLLQLTYIPGFIVGVLMLCGSESLRWLLVKGEREKIMKILNKAAKVNNRQLSPESIEIVNKKCENAAANANLTKSKNIDNQNMLKVLFTTKMFVFRFVISSFSWIAAIFFTYGISIVSVTLNSDQYFTYIITALGTIPSSFFTILMLKYVGRPKCTSICFLIAGATIVLTKLVAENHPELAFFLIFTGKCFSTVALGIVYVHTTELWPTPLRQSLMGLSSTIGRVGSILAPLLPLLAHFTELLPFLTFGIVSIFAAGLVLLLPDTRHKELPDTIEQAKKLGEKDDLIA